MYDVVLVTCPDEGSAKRVADILVNRKLAACVSIVPGLTSIFLWRGERHEAREVLLIIKTRHELLKKLIMAVKENHDYKNPEIIALPVIGGSKEYTSWIDEETGKRGI